VLRIEPLSSAIVSTLSGFHPFRNMARPAAPAVLKKAAHFPWPGIAGP
jgi:hypothetical protein